MLHRSPQDFARAGHVERYQLQSYRFKHFFDALKLSLFICENIAVYNGLRCNG
jgi:hypothetical protein